MLRQKRSFTDEFKKAAVDKVREGKKPADVAKEFGVARSALYRWVQESEGREAPKAKKTKSENAGGGTKRRYTEEFKRAVAQQVKDGRSAPKVAAACSIGRDLLYKWVHKYFPELRKPIKEVGTEHLAGVETRLETIENGRRETVQQHVGQIEATLSQGEAERRRREAEREKAERNEEESVRMMLADPLIWMQKYTQTKDSHWREAGASSPYRPFPDKPYFRSLVELFQQEPILFVEKSRDMMISWLSVGLFTHTAMTTEGIEVLFQSQKMEKAVELVEYAKILYERQHPAIRRRYPLRRGKQSDAELEFQHGSRIIAIPGGGDQIRSYHPWGLFQDEAAFMPEAGESYDHAVPVCQKIVVVSSAGPGWFADFVSQAA